MLYLVMLKQAKEHSFISIVIPCYKAGDFIIKTLQQVSAELKKLARDYEIICVIDGIVDDSFSKAKNFAKNNPHIKVFAYKKNRGKGYAVRYGLKRAKGEIIGFIDAGGEIDPASLVELVKTFDNKKADIVVGSKRHPNSDVVYPFLRRVFSLVYLYFIKVLFGIRLSDTQAGIKLFRKEVIKRLLPLLTVDGFAFDIEIITLAKVYGFDKVYEAPIKVRMLQSEKASTIENFGTLIKASLEMIYDSLKIYFKVRGGKV